MGAGPPGSRGEGGAVLRVTLPCLFADYVYFENSSSNPYLIRRIEELNKVTRVGGRVCSCVGVWACECTWVWG